MLRQKLLPFLVDLGFSPRVKKNKASARLTYVQQSCQQVHFFIGLAATARAKISKHRLLFTQGARQTEVNPPPTPVGERLLEGGDCATPPS